MGDTRISWTHRPGTRGRTWNPGQGCQRESEGCRNCYAERIAYRFARTGWSQGLINLSTKKWNGAARLSVHKLTEPLAWTDPSTIFVNSMSDLFYSGFSNEDIAAVFAIAAACSQHTFLMLTKRPLRAREWFAWLEDRVAQELDDWIDDETSIDAARAEARSSVLAEHAADALGDGSEASWTEWFDKISDLHRDAWARDGADGGTEWSMPWPLPNVWQGVSTENQAAAAKRIPDLLMTPAAVRFLSCEPLLDEIDLLPWLDPVGSCDCAPGASYCVGGCAKNAPWRYSDADGLDPRIDWVIVGCESGHGARPCDASWLRNLRDQCADYGVAFFLKQAEELTLAGDDPEPAITFGPGSDPKGAGPGKRPILENPYLDGEQHLEFPVIEGAA